MNEDAKELDEPWYCFICIAKRPVAAESPEKPTRGLFAPLLSSLRKRNPTNFELPQDIRDYFEGVATDRNGSFVEALNVAKNTRYVASFKRKLCYLLTLFSEVDLATPTSSPTTINCVTAKATLYHVTRVARHRKVSGPS